MGIPLLLMELGLGQKYQRGDISVFRNIHPRLAGIGVASVFSAYIITFYYNVIIAWSVVYVVVSFASPLPWSVHNQDWSTCSAAKASDIAGKTRAELFFYTDVVHFYDKTTCKAYADGDPSQFSWPAFGATLFVWVVMFIGVFKSVTGASKIVWCTVPVPLLFILIMVIYNNAALPGAQDGIKSYIFGDEEVKKNIDPAAMWADACGQIFFSIGVCMGIMTSYGSYNDVKKPIIRDNLIIAITNSTVSFVSGFAVWAVIGYLRHIKSLAASSTMSVSLAFVAYPTAIETMPGANAWAVLLGLTLFLLGVDSAFSMVEAAATVINDTETYRATPRWKISLVLCISGFLISIPFCTNWGFVLFDSIDHYLSNYLLLLVGILQCMGCGWAFDFEHTAKLSDGHYKSNLFLVVWYWTTLLILGAVGIWTSQGLVYMLAFVGQILFVGLPISYCLCGQPFTEWYKNVMMCGVRRIGYSISKLGREPVEVNGVKTYPEMKWYEPFFVFYWSVLIKYLIPCALWFIMMQAMKSDAADIYPKGYGAHWMYIGLVIPLLGIVTFLINLCFFVYDEKLNEDEFTTELPGEQNDFVINIAKVAPLADTEKDAVELAKTENGTVN